MSKKLFNPYLAFNNNCREGMEFYQQVLGGKLDLQTFGQGMPETHEDHKDNIMHAALEFEEGALMASDSMPGRPPQAGDNVSLSLSSPDNRLTKIWEGLAEGGTVTMPLEKQVWGDEFGMLTDKFGFHWMININHN